MLLRRKAVLALVLGATVLADTASAVPLGRIASGGNSLVVQADGIVCDVNGCQNYESGNRVFIEPDPPEPPPRRRPPPPPSYDDGEDTYTYDDPTIIVRPRVQRRVFVEPPPPPPRVHRRIYIDPAPDYPEPVRVLSRSHVRWCLNRYRSYNPRTDLYLARRNVYRRCISPFS